MKYLVFFFIFEAFIFTSSIKSTHAFAKEILSDNKTRAIPRKWLTQLFLEAENNFDMDSMVDSQCFKDYSFYKQHLNAQSGWAIRMLESSEWPTVGLLAATTTHLGNWDECLLVSTNYIRGKYCLIEGTYNFDKLVKNSSIVEAVEWPSDELSVWEILHMFEQNPVRVDRRTIKWAVCMPSSCSSTDLEISLRNILHPIFKNQDLDFQLHVHESSCHVKDETNIPEGYYYAVIFFLLTALIICLSTIYDTMEKKKGFQDSKLVEFLVSFSLLRNCRQLFKYSKKNDYGAVYAMKFVFIILIIYGHRRIFSLGYPTFNTERAEMNFKSRISYFELTHFTVVDVFFMLTGFLTFHLNFSSMSKHGFRYWFVSIVHRWMRLMPTLGSFLIFFVYIFPHLSDGPLWDEKITAEINYCKATWWSTLLAINNIVQTENQCLLVNWYNSVDMQLAVIGFALMYIMSKNRLWGWISIISTFVLGAVITFIVAYENKFHGILPTYIRFLQIPRLKRDFIDFYIALYPRIGPYLVGVIAALLTKMLNEKKFKFSTKQKVIGIILALIVSEGYLYYGFVMEYEFGHQFNALEHAFYSATYRSVYVIATALILCIYFTTGFSSLEAIYENWLFATIGRLTYSVFLVNTVLQMFHAASQRSALPSSNLINKFWWVAADSVYSYVFGACLYLFFEAPLANVSKLVKQWLLKKPEKRDTLPVHMEVNYPS